MTEIEAIAYPSNGCKVKTRKINHGLQFYPELYQLAKEVFESLDAKQDTHFQQLPYNKTSTIHQIGKAIASCSMFYLRTDLHDTEDYSNNDGFFILTQNSMLEVYFQQFGINDTALKRPTTEDKICIARIAITDEEMREFLPDLTGRLRGGDCLSPVSQRQ